MVFILLIAFIALICQTVVGTTPPDSAIEENPSLIYRLDETVLPSHYEIHMKPYLHDRNVEGKRFTFDGSTSITISTIQEGVNKIVLHARGLNFTATELVKESNIEQKIPVTVSDSEHLTHKLTVSLEEALEPNKNYVLKFVFSGKMKNLTQEGFFTDYYKNDDSEEIWFAATQFEPNLARRAFPCFDEPKFKATFTIHINRENEYTSVSNAKIAKRISVEGEPRTIDVYKPTPVMSSYLVAFLISDFKSRVSEHQNFTIWLAPRFFNETQVALDVGQKVLKKLEEFIGIPYSSIPGVEKLDIVGFPFFPGAMENWGLITMNEYYLISYEDEDDMYSIFAHELAHQWFGNLVTCDWWTHTWLNEGFASYMAYYITGQFLDYSKTEEKFVTEHMRRALYVDKWHSSFPLSGRTAEKSYELRQMFMTISYSKGSSIIRMIVNMMGVEPFRKAVHNYLNDNALQAVTPDRLFYALNKEWHNDELDMIEFLSDWTFQSGYPLVTVKLSEDGEYITVSQKRYGKLSEHDNDQWIIPITFTTNVENDFTNVTPRIFLKKNEERVVPLGHKADWVVANIRQTGYYRVQYNIENWIKLTEAVKAPNASGIHHINHVQLRDDSLDFFSIGEVDINFMSKIYGLNLGEVYGTPKTEPGESYPTAEEINKKIMKFSKKRIGVLKKVVRANKFDDFNATETTVGNDTDDDAANDE